MHTKYLKYLIHGLLAFSSLSCKSQGQYIDELKKYFHVSAKNGLNVRDFPSSNASIIGKLEFGYAAEIVKETNVLTRISVEDKIIEARWVKIPYEYYDEAYILNVFLIPWNEIPPHSLYYYYSLYFGLPAGEFQNGVRISYNENPSMDYFRHDKPYPYYEKNSSEPSVTINGKGIEYYNDSVLDTLKSFLQLELVDINDYKSKKVACAYVVDTTHVEKKIPIKIPGKNAFYLYTQHGKDSVLISDEDLRGTSVHFAGQIPYLNKYVINSSYEASRHSFIDKITGKRETFTGGLPYISPDGKYVADFLQTPTDYNNDACGLTISKLDDSLQIISTFQVEFKTWLPVETPNTAFWISNRELIIKVFAIMNEIDGRGEGRKHDPKNFHYQYIKLKILEQK